MSTHQKSRSAGTRRLMDQLIKDGCLLARGSNFAYWRCVYSLRQYTQLLNHQRLRSSEGCRSVRVILLAVVQLARQENDWLHAPETYDPHKGANAAEQWIGFVSHVLQQYPCPRFLAACWLQPIYKTWYAKLHSHLGAGLSVRKFRLPDGTHCDKSTACFLMQAPDDANPEQAFRWAQVMATAKQLRVDCDPILARNIMQRLPIGDDAEVESFWRESLRFFVRNPMSAEQLDEVIDAVRNLRLTPTNELFEYSRVTAPLMPDLSIANRTKRSVLRLIANWNHRYAPAAPTVRRRTRFPVPSESWSGLKIRPFEHFVDSENESSGKVPVRWAIVQLLTADELIFEGKALKHCVGSYAYRCGRGRTSIWSLRQCVGDTIRRVVTIELIPERFVITQVKGKSNRAPNDQELGLIEQWAQENQLRFGKAM